MVFVTDPQKGILRPMGIAQDIPLFDVPQKVGGRFSVLSSVSLLPLALVGIDIKKLMKGARAMRDEIQKTAGKKNKALQLALAQYKMDHEKKRP
ncbi:hypothetical protein IPJ72_01690 [Candidatus Peregrinibacteria bacterium]|nr:MAG: hypothetical protein IPJ72_01690 [Candidatus Peregrinibacteria bacterium]